MTSYEHSQHESDLTPSYVPRHAYRPDAEEQLVAAPPAPRRLLGLRGERRGLRVVEDPTGP